MASRIRRTVVAEWLHVDFVGDRPCGPQMSGVLVGAWDLEIEGPHGTADAGVGAPLPNDPGLIPESFVYLTSRHSGTAMKIATDCRLSHYQTIPECHSPSSTLVSEGDCLPCVGKSASVALPPESRTRRQNNYIIRA